MDDPFARRRIVLLGLLYRKLRRISKKIGAEKVEQAGADYQSLFQVFQYLSRIPQAIDPQKREQDLTESCLEMNDLIQKAFHNYSLVLENQIFRSTVDTSIYSYIQEKDQ